MILKSLVNLVVTTALLTFAMLSTPAMAERDNAFSALQGVEAQALSSQEMNAISGELNAFDIAAALIAKAATLDKFPRLQATVLKLADYYKTNADAINALFVKLHIFTPCQTCAP
jgi:hypothetical protein